MKEFIEVILPNNSCKTELCTLAEFSKVILVFPLFV